MLYSNKLILEVSGKRQIMLQNYEFIVLIYIKRTVAIFYIFHYLFV